MVKGGKMKMFFNHGIHRIHGMIVSLVLLFGVAVSAVAAEPGITVEARQRYPWNGLVDLKFTITGESGTKYDTSFTAKDMVGGTNIAMKTIRKSDGTSAAAVEQLLPGSYNWVWDAPADLQVDTVFYNDFLTDSSKVVITNRLLSATANVYAVFGGSSISQSIGSTEGYAYNVKTDGNGKSIQFQVLNGGYLKCVCVHLEQSGSDIVGHIKWARYMSPTFPLGTDFDTAEYTEYDFSTSDSVTGYGIKQLVLTYRNPSCEPKFDRLTVTGTADLSAFPYTVKFNANGGTGTMANQSFTYGTSKALMANAFTRTGYVFQGWATSASGGKVYNDKQKVQDLTTTSGAVVNLYAVWKAALYMVVDLSSGANSSKYPVSYLDAVPSGGWSDEYKTTKLVLRRINKGTNSAGGSMSIDMWVGVFEVTQKQYLLVLGDDAYPSCYDYINWHCAKNNRYPIESVGPFEINDFLSKLKTKTILKKARRPALAEWQYACRAGTTTDLNNGKSLTVVNANRVAYWGIRVSGSTAYEKWGYGTGKPAIVGSYSPNSWGLYDMHGNVSESTTHAENLVGGSVYYYSGGSWRSELSEIKVTSECPHDSYQPEAGGFRVFADVE
jgi:uncharacterized repeat protein (TIGR02543 family)